jgi:transposase
MEPPRNPGRFTKPTQLGDYLGLVPSEHTSDNKRRQGAITKAGPSHPRRLLVEAAWHYRHPPRIGRALDRRPGKRCLTRH